MSHLWGFFINAGERLTITTRYVVSNVEIFILVYLLLLLLFIYNEIKKQEKNNAKI